MRDDFSEETKRVLCERVGGICSNPACVCATIGPNDDPNKRTSIGQACHITAASSGGPRYDASLSKEDRSDIENGIWLCSNCALLIDNDPNRYSKYLLKGWKYEAERRQRDSLGKMHSDLSNVIRHPETFITLGRQENGIEIRYCSRCFDVDSKLVQLSCFNGNYKCPNCQNSGIYDIEEVRANIKPRARRTLSKGITS